MKSKRRRRNDVVLNCSSVWKLQSCCVFLRVERSPNLVLVLPHYCNVSNLGPSKWRGSDGPDPGRENSESDSIGDSSELRTDSAAAEWQRRSWTDVYGRELDRREKFVVSGFLFVIYEIWFYEVVMEWRQLLEGVK